MSFDDITLRSFFITQRQPFGYISPPNGLSRHGSDVNHDASPDPKMHPGSLALPLREPPTRMSHPGSPFFGKGEADSGCESRTQCG